MSKKTKTWSTLQNWKFRILPTDTRSIITSVFLGLTMAVVLQITERIDLALTGGTIAIVSAIVVCLIYFPAVMFYGLTGGLITAWINPIISNLTASQPLAPWLFVTNASHAVPMVLLAWLMKPKHRGLRLWEVIVIGQVGGILDAVAFGIGSRLILHMPWDFIGFQILILQPLYFVGSLIGFVILGRLLKTGLVARSSNEKKNTAV